MADEERPTGKRLTVKARRLGSELRRLREASGNTMGEVADAIDCSPSKISRIETGGTGIRTTDLRALLDLYGIEEPERREALTRLARERKEEGWWSRYGDTLSPQHSDLLGLESDAESIRTWENAVVPGLLQTPEYLAALLEAGPEPCSPERLDRLVQVRLERQTLLGGDRAPHYHAVVWEPALRSPVGGSQVHLAQLERVRKAAEQPNVTVQVLPLNAGAHPGVRGAFSIFTFADSPDAGAVFTESLTSSHYLDHQPELHAYTGAFVRLCATALGPGDSLDLISEIMKGV
jgi:transcriptional regulator with XRE-family HTH domain